jgi:uracil-DNA glycosylase family 4
MKQPALGCRRCPRLVALRQSSRKLYPAYHSAAVRFFGEASADLLVVGLAPGMQGANKTGRPFSGDGSGDWLYANLFRLGFSSSPDDSKALLRNAAITNAVKCVPPDNKPIAAEVNQCSEFLTSELSHCGKVVIALGRVAHEAVLKSFTLRLAEYPFGHASEYQLPDGRILISSYHCSRYNVQTRRLTRDQFDAVFDMAALRLQTNTP